MSRPRGIRPSCTTDARAAKRTAGASRMLAYSAGGHPLGNGSDVSGTDPRSADASEHVEALCAQ
ncbi:MAG: hypothetical protein ACYTDW_09295 [Planctomycetota bacterium]